MKKKKKYIRPEVEVFQVEIDNLLRVSEINDNPWADAKKHDAAFTEDEWEQSEPNVWRVGYENDFPATKSVWDE